MNKSFKYDDIGNQISDFTKGEKLGSGQFGSL